VEGLSPITAFFSPKAVRGRKKKIKGQSNAGRPKLQKDIPAPVAAVAPEASKQSYKKPEATRKNWAKGEGLKLKRLSDSLAIWEEERAKIVRTFVRSHRNIRFHIPTQPCNNISLPMRGKKIKLGDGVGKRPLISSESQEVIVDVLVRKDRANEGAGVGEARHPQAYSPRTETLTN
jgi:hypothetical protein